MERFEETSGELKRGVYSIEQKGKESLSLLKITEGLVKRDISLIRKEIDIIVRNLEDKALSELKELYENEQENIHVVISDVKQRLEQAQRTPSDEDTCILKDTENILEEYKTMVTRKRFVFEPNRQIIVALEQLQTLGDTKLKELTDCGNEQISPNHLNATGKPFAKDIASSKENSLATHQSIAMKEVQECKVIPNGLDVSNNIDPFAVLRAMNVVDSSCEK